MSVEGVNRAFSERLRLNHGILQNKYWYLSYDNKGHESYVPVGRGGRKSPFCGAWSSVDVCMNVAGHDGLFIGCTDCTGKVVVRHRHMWCTDPSCPVCFAHGWSVLRARVIVGRLNEGVRRGLGEPEHIMVSPPRADWNLPEPVLRAKCWKALLDRGSNAVGSIFHGYREDKERHVLVWRPHYHCIGFFRGGYKCRGCPKLASASKAVCSGCSGFEGLTRRLNATDGFIVKVGQKRETLFGTAWYQCNHATLRLGVRRFHVVNWFGELACCKFKSEKVKTENLCPACGEDMVKCYHVGKRVLVKDVGSPDYVPVFVDDQFDASGQANYVPVVGDKFG